MKYIIATAILLALMGAGCGKPAATTVNVGSATESVEQPQPEHVTPSSTPETQTPDGQAPDGKG